MLEIVIFPCQMRAGCWLGWHKLKCQITILTSKKVIKYKLLRERLSQVVWCLVSQILITSLTASPLFSRVCLIKDYGDKEEKYNSFIKPRAMFAFHRINQRPFKNNNDSEQIQNIYCSNHSQISQYCSNCIMFSKIIRIAER